MTDLAASLRKRAQEIIDLHSEWPYTNADQHPDVLRYQAAAAEIERLTRAVEGLGVHAREAERDIAAAEAERDGLREALAKIAAQCPETQPPPAWDEWGHQIADTSDRHAGRVSAQDRWNIGCLARAALRGDAG